MVRSYGTGTIKRTKNLLCRQKELRRAAPSERAMAAMGDVFTRRSQSLGSRDRPTSPRSSWQNAYAEGLFGSIRRKCLDQVVVFGERQHVRSCYINYYNATRPHLFLSKDTPIQRSVQSVGRIQANPVLGDLQHQ